MTDTLRNATDDRAGHQHRLGPFDAESDPSEHDAAIVALAGALWEECASCRLAHTPAVADSTPALLRLIELVGRACTGRYGSVRDLGFAWIADLVEADPAEGAAILQQLGPEGRAKTTGTLIELLVGVWWLKQMRAEAPARAAAAIQQTRDRYDLPAADTAPAWAWAHLHAATGTDDSASAGSSTIVFTLHLAGDDESLLGPITLKHTPIEREADLILDALGWTPAWSGGRWAAAPEALAQGDFIWPDDQAGNRSDSGRVMRVRRGAPEPPQPAPYYEDFRWPLETGRDFPDNDSTTGPPPGRVRYALRSIVWSQNGEHDRYIASTPLADLASMRQHLAERTAEARQIVAEFHQWLHGQLQVHGWPRAGADFQNFSLAVLAWVASDPDEHRRTESAERLAADIAAGHADPAYLDALSGPDPMPTAALLEAVCRSYPE